MYTAKEAEISRLFELTRLEIDGKIFHPINSFRLLIDEKSMEANLLWLVHHTRLDGWSMSLLVAEVRAILRGQELRNNPPQFWQVASEVRQYMDETYAEGFQFWQKSLAKVKNATPLTLPKPTVPIEEAHMGDTRVTIDLSLSAIDQLCRIEGVTSATMIYATWALLLRFYTSQEQVLFGTVFSGRHIAVPDIDEVVSPVLNSCPIPADLSRLKTKPHLLHYMHELVVRVNSHQWSAIDAMQEAMPGS